MEIRKASKNRQQNFNLGNVIINSTFMQDMAMVDPNDPSVIFVQ